MPRSVDDILKHADELAARFESYEPEPDQEMDGGAVAALRGAVQERSEAERHTLPRSTPEAGRLRQDAAQDRHPPEGAARAGRRILRHPHHL